MKPDWLASTIERLTTHFHSVEVGPPSDADDLARLISRFGRIPDDVECYYRECGLIKVVLDFGRDGTLYPLTKSLDYMPIAIDCDGVERLLPIRDDGCGDYDCVVMGPGIGEGAVVFWDHEVYDWPAYLLAGSFAAYLDMWADFLVVTYLPDGTQHPDYALDWTNERGIPTSEKQHPWPFDEKWVTSRDPSAKLLLSDPLIREWLQEQDEG